MFTINGKYNKATIYADYCDKFAIGTITKMLNSEMFSKSNIAIMPDVHQSKGAVVGTTINNGDNMFDRISPEIIGTDLGCGIMAAKLNTTNINKKDLVILDEFINNSKQFSSVNMTDILKSVISPVIDSDVLSSTSTLGGGNHFIELAVGSDDHIWIVVHTGSRKLGKQIATNYIDKSIFQKGDLLPSITDSILSDYINDLNIAQEYAELNRKSIIDGICNFMNWKIINIIDSNHNYLDLKTNTIRKGATSSKLNEELIIPINMRDGSLIVKGLGNQDWNESSPHGAGRLLTRGDAKQLITLSEFQKEMSGIYSTSITTSKISESPEVYKNIDYIIENIVETAILCDIIKPVYNYKS